MYYSYVVYHFVIGYFVLGKYKQKDGPNICVKIGLNHIQANIYMVFLLLTPTRHSFVTSSVSYETSRAQQQQRQNKRNNRKTNKVYSTSASLHSKGTLSW